MREKLEGVVPVVLAILLALFLYFNNSTPTESLNGYAIVQPVKEFKAIRTLSDPKEEEMCIRDSKISCAFEYQEGICAVLENKHKFLNSKIYRCV